MKRWVFSLVSVLSLFLCVSACGMWIGSYRWLFDYSIVQFRTGPNLWGVRNLDFQTLNGEFSVTLSTLAEWTQPDAANESYEYGPRWTFKGNMKHPGAGRLLYPKGLAHPPSPLNRIGLYHFTALNGFDYFRGVSAIIPYWFIVLVTAVCPLLWLHRWHQNRSARSIGLCDKCGYDLRATPDRCPECGAETPKVGA